MPSQVTSHGMLRSAVTAAMIGGACLSLSSCKPQVEPVGRVSITHSAALFKNPVDVAFSGHNAWIANADSNTIDELSSASGVLVRQIRASSDRFHTPSAIVANDRYVWVKNLNSVTQLSASNGSLVRVITSSVPSFFLSGTLAVCGSGLWYANSNYLMKYSAGTGQLEARINLGPRGESHPIWLAVASDAHMWIGGLTSNVLVQLNCSSGVVTRTVTLPLKHANAGMVALGGELWVSSFSTVVEMSQLSGQIERIISAKSYHLSGGRIAASGRSIWVLSRVANMATEIDGPTGSLDRIFRLGYATFTPIDIQANRGTVWMLCGQGNAVAIVNGNSGRLVHYLGSKSL